MTLKTVKYLLWTVAAVLTAGSAMVGVETSRVTNWAAVVEVPKTSGNSANAAQGVDLPELAELQNLCQRDLRAPLYDPPPAPPPARPPPPPPPPPPPFTLAGTVIETGHCQAILVMADGKVEFKKLGDSAEGALLTQIDRDSAIFKYQDRSVVLKVVKKE